MKTPPRRLKFAWPSAIAGFAICVAVAVCPFVGLGRLYAPLTLLLLVGAIPLLYASIRVLVHRMNTQSNANFGSVFFDGIPPWFVTLYQVGLAVTCAVGINAMIQGVVKRHPDWLGLLFVLVPAVFYLTCIGVFWSAAREVGEDD